MPTVWFNQGYSNLRDALVMIRAEARGRVRLLASHRDPWAPVLAAADLGFVEPPFEREQPEGEAAYVDWCLSVCREHGVDLFVPQAARVTLARRAAAFTAVGTRLSLASNADGLELLDEKGRFYEAARQAGFPTPRVYEVTTVDGFDRALAALADAGMEPCVKPPVGVFGAGFWRLDESLNLFQQLMTPDQRRLNAATVRRALAEAPAGTARLLVMQLLPGAEWSVDCVAKDGATLAAVSRKKQRAHQEIETAGPVVELARAAIAHFKLSGLLNVQIKAAGEGEGDPHLLEINPRMSGGCLYTAFSGVNLPWLHVASELNLPSKPTPAGRPALVAAVANAQLVTPDVRGPRQFSDLMRAGVHA